MKKNEISKRALSIVLALVSVISVIFCCPFTASAASWPSTKNIKTYVLSTKNDTTVYQTATSTSKYGTIYASDLITIKGYSGSRLKVTYPISSGTKTGYIEKSKVTSASINTASAKWTATANMTAYRRSSGSATIGSVSKGDVCYTLATAGSRTQVIYPISGGYKMGWVASSSVPSTSLVNVTSSFAGKKIKIQSVQSGKYLCADANITNTPIVCNRNNAATWETFTVSNLTSDGWVGFKASTNGKYLSAIKDVTNTPIRATASKLQSWECFRIYQKGSDYYIKAQVNKKWLCARVDISNYPLQACASSASSWERFKIITVDSNDSTSQSATFWQWPIKKYVVTQNFANYSTTMANSKGRPYHSGIDIVGQSDKTIYATADGTVKYKGFSNGNGYHIVLQHNFNGKTVYSLYSHLSSYKDCPEEGKTVTKGKKIGIEGSTGNSTGSHLHFAIFTGYSSDPLGYVQTKNSSNVLKSGNYTFYNPTYVISNQMLP
ncbi:MAG: M23 family metallopeptidase [Clostridia bacterium]|nr:M23 family metallopeptidase [Clostridia bacterium]